MSITRYSWSGQTDLHIPISLSQLLINMQIWELHPSTVEDQTASVSDAIAPRTERLT